MVWIVGPILAIILFVFLIVLICVLRKRRQNTKRPLEAGAVMTPLMSGETVDINFILICVSLKYTIMSLQLIQITYENVVLDHIKWSSKINII